MPDLDDAGLDQLLLRALVKVIVGPGMTRVMDHNDAIRKSGGVPDQARMRRERAASRNPRGSRPPGTAASHEEYLANAGKLERKNRAADVLRADPSQNMTP